GSGTIKGIGSAAMNDAVTAAASVSNLTLATGAASSDTLTVNNYTGGSGSTTHVTGSGEVILPNANTYAGGWMIDSGTLQVQHANALGTGTSAVSVDGTLQIHGGVVLTRDIAMNTGSTL